MRTLKKIRRRLLSVILCLCIVLSSFAYADTAYTTDGISPQENQIENSIANGTETSPERVQDAASGREAIGGGYKADRF